MPLLIYIHGFNSSPDSLKAQQTRHWFQHNAPHVDVVIPKIPPFAAQAMALLQPLVENNGAQPVYVMGSSMGGFFASCLVERYQLKGVLINPAVDPSRGLANWVGENANYHTGEKWIFEPEHIEEYRALEGKMPADPKKYLLLLQTGDEVLDYRSAQQRYKNSHLVIEQGGDHSFVGYQQHLPQIYRFLTSEHNFDNRQ